MKKLKTWGKHWRQRRAAAPEEIPEPMETVATDEPPVSETSPRRSRTTLLGLGLLVLVAALLGALAFAPGLRDTTAGRKLRFWEKPAPPPPAVPPGQMAREMEEAQAKNPSGVITIDQDTAEALPG